MTKPNKRNVGSLEQGRHAFQDDDPLTCPRMVARIWGMVAAISFISSGGTLLVNATTKKCKITGVYMLVIGIITLLLECPCCLLLIRPGNKLCGAFERNVPFWVKGLFYFVFMLTPLILCFSWKTMLSALTFIILGLLYFFLTCLQGSKRYERLRGEINHELNRTREQVNFTYNSVNHASATINAFQNAARNTQAQQQRGKTASKSSSKSHKTRI